MKKNKMILSILALSTLISTPLISLSCIKTQTKDEFRAQVEDSLEFNNEEINIHQLDKLNVSSDAIWFNNQEVVYSIRNPKIVTSSVTGKQHVELTIAVKDKQTSNVIFIIKRQLSSFKEISENDWEEIIKNYNKQTKFEWNTPEEVNYNLNITHKDVKIINDNAKRVEVVSVSSTYDEIIFGYKLHFATPDAKERESELFISRVKKDQLGRPVVTFSYNNNETTQNIVTNIHNQIDEPVGIKEDQKILKALYLDEEQNVEVKFANGKSDYKFTKNTTLYPKFVEPTIIYVLNKDKTQDSNRTITLGANGKVNKKQLSLREWGGPAISAKKKVGKWLVLENGKENEELDFDEEGNSTRVFEDGETYKIFPEYIDAEAAKFNLLTQKGKLLGQVKGTSDGKLPNLASHDFGKENPELDGKEPESFYLDKEFKRPISKALSFKNDTVNDVYVKFKNMVKVELYPINAPSDMNNTNYYFYINSKYKAVESSLATEFDPEILLSENEKSGKKFYSYDYLVNNLNIKDENPEESESYALVLRNDPELEPVDISEFSTLYNWYRNKDTVQLIAIAQEPYEKKVKKARGVFLSILDSFKKVNHAILNNKYGIAKAIYRNNEKVNNEEYWKISTTKKLDEEQKDYSYIDNYIKANDNNKNNVKVNINWELQVNAAIEIMELATNLLLGGAYTYKQLENFINNLTTRLELLLLKINDNNENGIMLFMQNLRFAVIKIIKKNRKYLDSTGQFFVNNDGVAEKPDIDANKNKVVELDIHKTYDELEYDGARLYSIEFPKNNGKENKDQQVSTNKKRVVKIELGNGPKYIIYSIFDHIMAQVTRWVELYNGSQSKNATKIRDVFELFIGRFTSVDKEGEKESQKVNTSIDDYYFREANSFDNKNIDSTSYRWRLDNYAPENNLYLKYQSIVRGMWELIDKYNNDNNINELIDGIQDLIPKLIRAINIIGSIWNSNGSIGSNNNEKFQEGTTIDATKRYAIENIVEQLIGRKSIYRQLIIKDK
ncbi:variable surface lipoprotein [Mycoplasma sp. M5725]|uniref:Variable surface lipoprotein n=1 Tax=Mycoplasma phocimorsus TaxID=3045839 RepID=A0AAJ1PRK8_9MOLU|nr:variable surface lipoprotein [Mycoplasma phocimorsus]MDJ1645556.1 variable surface lipoprotein [Mycoplasma phocimorsus]